MIKKEIDKIKKQFNIQNPKKKNDDNVLKTMLLLKEKYKFKEPSNDEEKLEKILVECFNFPEL